MTRIKDNFHSSEVYFVQSNYLFNLIKVRLDQTLYLLVSFFLNRIVVNSQERHSLSLRRSVKG